MARKLKLTTEDRVKEWGKIHRNPPVRYTLDDMLRLTAIELPEKLRDYVSSLFPPFPVKQLEPALPENWLQEALQSCIGVAFGTHAGNVSDEGIVEAIPTERPPGEITLEGKREALNGHWLAMKLMSELNGKSNRAAELAFVLGQITERLRLRQFEHDAASGYGTIKGGKTVVEQRFGSESERAARRQEIRTAWSKEYRDEESRLGTKPKKRMIDKTIGKRFNLKERAVRDARRL